MIGPFKIIKVEEGFDVHVELISLGGAGLKGRDLWKLMKSHATVEIRDMADPRGMEEYEHGFNEVLHQIRRHQEAEIAEIVARVTKEVLKKSIDAPSIERATRLMIEAEEVIRSLMREARGVRPCDHNWGSARAVGYIADGKTQYHQPCLRCGLMREVGP